MGSYSSSKNAGDEIVIQSQQVSLAYTGSPKALLETLQLFVPLGESSAIINQLKKIRRPLWLHLKQSTPSSTR